MIGISFPVTGIEGVENVPWSIVEAHRAEIQKAKGLPLERLHTLGGMDGAELASIMAGRAVRAHEIADLMAEHLELCKGGEYARAVGKLEHSRVVGKLAAAVVAAALSMFFTAEPARAQVTGITNPYAAIAPNNTTGVLVKGAPGTIFSVQMFGIGAAPAYLKLYDAVAAPTCGSGTPVKRIQIPANATAALGVAVSIVFPVGVKFLNGIGYCITTGITDADTTAPAANTFLVNIDWN